MSEDLSGHLPEDATTGSDSLEEQMADTNAQINFHDSLGYLLPAQFQASADSLNLRNDVPVAEPFDALFEAITQWKPGSLTPEQLVDNVQVMIGRPIVGQERTDLESLASEELEYDKEMFGQPEEE